MKDDKNMEQLVVLYFIDLTYGSVGQGKVSESDLAHWFMVSKPTVAKFMDKMSDDGLIQIVRQSAKTVNGFVIKYALTVEGKTHLDNNYESAYELYRIQVARILAAIIAGRNVVPEYRKLTAKERRAIAAGQKELL